MTEKTQEQIQAEAAAAAAAAAKAAEAAAAKEAKKAAKAAEKEAATKAKADAKAAKAAAEAAAKAEKQAAAEAKKAEKEAAKAAKAATAQPEQNGVKRPKEGTACAIVWGLCDSVSTALQQPAPVDKVLEAGIAQGINTSTIRTQYAHWKKFNGLTGRITAPAPEAAAA